MKYEVAMEIVAPQQHIATCHGSAIRHDYLSALDFHCERECHDMPFVKCRSSRIALAVSAALLAAVPAARAEGDPQLEGIVVTGDRPATAPYEAPTQGSLDAGEPQSIINQHFIENNATTGANYTDIINIAPSVADTTPNGKGNAESLNLSIRGFQDGQFNVTFDGIPFNDSNDFTHHSTSYFTANTLGKVTVDRGPGTAAQIGNATFGGTVALQTKDPMMTRNVSPSLTLGTWRTNDYSVQVDTGTIAQAADGRATLTLTSINSDGAMTNNAQERKNAMFKYVQPISADTSVTAVVMYNTVHQNVSQFGTTLAQIGQFGPHYSLSSNPSSDSYYGFNFDDIHTDFEYIQLQTKVSGVRLDNKAYTYAYYHQINETNDPSLALGSKGAYDLANGTALNAGDPTSNDVSGQKGSNNYRSVGDIFRAEADVGPGVARGGLWVDYQWNDRYLYDVDWTQGGTVDPNGDVGGLQRDLHDSLTSIDPFVEYEFRPTDALSITPGVRYSSFARKIDGSFVPGVNGPDSYSHTWSGTQPSLYALYRLASNASVYAQFARGFLAPKDKIAFQKSTAAADAFSPQRTTNYQVGGAWKAQDLTVSADVYHIKFNNFFTVSSHGAALIESGGGSAVFKGIELEGTYVLGYGFSLYGNWTHNTQTYADGTKVQYAPDGTWAAGAIYDDGRLYGSLLAKHIGNTLQAGNNGPVGGNYEIPAYTINDATIGYTFKNPTNGFKDIKARLNVSDLANNHSIYFVYGATLGGTDMFMTLPGRAYSITLSADF
jgi:iron complex outermembrane receptor protein